jgi:hypothetical protein
VTNPIPRPALHKAPDAEVHPAAARAVHPKPASPPTDKPQPAGGPANSLVDRRRLSAVAPKAKRPADKRPFQGNTSDTIRKSSKPSKQEAKPSAQPKPAEFTVKIPKQLKKDFRAKSAKHGYRPDDVIAELMRVWLAGQ